MDNTTSYIKDTAQQLTDAYLLRFPAKAAREIAKMPNQEAVSLLSQQPASVVANLFPYMPPGLGEQLIANWEPAAAMELLLKLDIQLTAALLSRLEDEQREAILARIAATEKATEKELTELLSYPLNTAGRMMDARVQMFHADLTVEEVLQQIKYRRPKHMDAFFLINDERNVIGIFELSDLILANAKDKASKIVRPITASFSTLDPVDDVIEKFEGMRANSLPVLDVHDQVVGLIRSADIYQRTKEDLASDIASMVGASKDEKALSSSWFAVRKRMPWLQINLVTAFVAAGVVGAFEGIISKYTALAILLPVAAGQSGNAGAQALAVTMRGLILKEITIRNMGQVFRKESFAGFLNGVIIAVTCAIGVWIWSRSIGLALIIALAMVLSLTIACGAGALVPMALKKLGLDPAQSSSIVLTTVTDIAGFMSFLGIATLLSGLLPEG
ncbi:magnesium transporter [Hahella sp. HN01]|uniref:magnesium transporter n=1 Tax=unclassified Hahella TaxID=2624107 RepID=UPI001C1EFED1|nr:magnesium transporter [Hahella sp. HN01]MBU6951191.1 magnesium transporter [Hahella sp. HN01]